MDLLRTVFAAGLHLRVGVQHVEEAFGVDERVVHVVEDALQLGDGRDDVGEEHHVVHDLADAHSGILDENQIRREDDDQHRSYLPHEALEAVEVERHLACLHLVLGHLVLYVQLLLPLDLLAVERLDDRDGVDDVLDALALGLQVGAHFAAPALQALGLPDGDPEIHRNDAQGHKSYVHVGREHQDEGEGGAGEQRQQVYEEILHRARDAAHSLVDTRLDLAGGVRVGVEEGHAEGEHLFDDGLRQVARHEDAHPLTVVVLGEGDSCGEDLLSQQHRRDNDEDAGGAAPGEIRAYQRVDGVHGAVQHYGVDLLHHGPNEREDEGDRHQEPVRLYERAYVLEQLDQVHFAVLLSLQKYE